MYLNTKNFRELDENKLIRFLDIKIKEDMYLDYKVDLPSIEKGKTHKEFLKDVTAFANANGGNILIGVKEPSDEFTIKEQLLGIENANQLAQDLERLTISSIDPRIPGLIIKTVFLSNGKSVIVVHIPPSLSRPHMVNYDKHRTFYVRNIESSIPMTSHEIRQSVMQTLTMEESVKNYMLEKEEDMLNYFLNEIPTFFIQGIPLISLESKWDVFNEKINNVISGVNLSYGREFNFSSPIVPKATIDGILGTNSRENPIWQTEIHRNGYVSCVYRNQFPSSNNQNEYIVHSDFKYLFHSYFFFLEAVLTATQTDLPYIISCKYFGANKTRMVTEKPRYNSSLPYFKNNIVFPLHYRQIGEEFLNISNELLRELFNAYGYRNVSD